MLKQLRLRFIEGINYDKDIVYGESFDLKNLSDISHLLNYSCNSPYGFILEGSTFERGKYPCVLNGIISNEFNPILEVINGIDSIDGKSFKFINSDYAKMPYHVIYSSNLEIESSLRNLLLCAIDSVDKVLEYTNEKLANNENIKQYQKII